MNFKNALTMSWQDARSIQTRQLLAWRAVLKDDVWTKVLIETESRTQPAIGLPHHQRSLAEIDEQVPRGADIDAIVFRLRDELTPIDTSSLMTVLNKSCST